MFLFTFGTLLASSCVRPRTGMVSMAPEQQRHEVAGSAFLSISSSLAGFEIPNCVRGIEPSHVLQREGYTVGYSDELRIPLWAAWQLTADETYGDVPRDGGFYEDSSVPFPRAQNADYRGSVWSRGHMAPAGDMKWSAGAMHESCLLTNVCPQDRNLNQNDWETVESRTRIWARKYGSAYVVCGPLFMNTPVRRIGDNGVAVPDAFFKVILVNDEKWQSIAFVFQNIPDRQYPKDRVCLVDDVEDMTGYDFFSMLPDEIEVAIEGTVDFSFWSI